MVAIHASIEDVTQLIESVPPKDGPVDVLLATIREGAMSFRALRHR